MVEYKFSSHLIGRKMVGEAKVNGIINLIRPIPSNMLCGCSGFRLIHLEVFQLNELDLKVKVKIIIHRFNYQNVIIIKSVSKWWGKKKKNSRKLFTWCFQFGESNGVR